MPFRGRPTKVLSFVFVVAGFGFVVQDVAQVDRFLMDGHVERASHDAMDFGNGCPRHAVQDAVGRTLWQEEVVPVARLGALLPEVADIEDNPHRALLDPAPRRWASSWHPWDRVIEVAEAEGADDRRRLRLAVRARWSREVLLVIVGLRRAERFPLEVNLAPDLGEVAAAGVVDAHSHEAVARIQVAGGENRGSRLRCALRPLFDFVEVLVERARVLLTENAGESTEPFGVQRYALEVCALLRYGRERTGGASDGSPGNRGMGALSG